LSKASGVGTATIQRIEKGDSPIGGYVSTLVRVQAAFEDAGVLFIDDDGAAGIGLRLAKKKRRRSTSIIEENGGGPGVRLRKRHPKKG
jgi:hypothetical protein